MDITYGLLSMLFWGIAIFLAAIASRKIGNILTLFWMELFGILVGILYFVFNIDSTKFEFIEKNFIYIFAIAALQLTAYLCFYKGLEKGKVTLVGPLGATWGLVVLILNIIFADASLDIFKVFGVVGILSGIIFLAFNFKEFFKNKKIDMSAGIKEGILAMLGWGISLFLLSYPTKDLGWFLPAFLFRIVLAVLLIFYILFKRIKLFSGIDKKVFLILLLIGATDMAAFMVFSYGLSKGSPTTVSLIGSSYSLVTILLAKIFLKEKLDLWKIAGIVFISGGIVLLGLK